MKNYAERNIIFSRNLQKFLSSYRHDVSNIETGDRQGNHLSLQRRE